MTKNLSFLSSLKAGKTALKKVEKVCDAIKFITRVENLANANSNSNSNSTLNAVASRDEKYLLYQTFCETVRKAGES